MIATIHRTGLRRCGRELRHAGLAGLPRQVAGQGGQLAAGLGVQRPAGPVLELVQGQPADRGVIAQRAQHRVAFGIGNPEGVIGFAHCDLRLDATPKRRRRRLLATTRTEDKVIAAAAMSGLNKPAAASGTAATL